MVEIRKIPKNEGTKGRGTLDSLQTDKGLTLEPKRRRGRPPGKGIGPSRAKNPGKAAVRKTKKGIPLEEQDLLKFAKSVEEKAEEALTAQVLKGNHPLSFSHLERFQMRAMAEEGYSKVDIASRFSTTIPLVSQVLRLKENMSKVREGQLMGHFFEFSKLLEDIVQGMDKGKIDRASFSQLSLAMGITFDKLLAVRKALDGDAPEVHQHELAIGTFQDREDLKNHVKGQLERLRESGKLGDLIPVEAQVLPIGGGGTPTSQKESSPPSDPDQLQLFQSKEPE